jgi:alkylhydroperoxidase/carboxymuconolactone decarboxylase family protein YurZ
MMSDALDYLLKVRPGAMKSYFDFIKQSAGSLDMKTRAIISVITKVENQTEPGLKQYLKRALKEGVTADEIIDALFVAFPTLGLTKIIWAIDIILKMELAEFSPEALSQEKSWHDVAAVDELIDKAENSNIKVFDSHCPHQATNIPALVLENCTLTCPKHGWKFDVRSGKCIEYGDRPLHEFENRMNDGRLEVLW